MARSMILESFYQRECSGESSLENAPLIAAVSSVMGWMRAHAHGCAPVHKSFEYRVACKGHINESERHG